MHRADCIVVCCVVVGAVVVVVAGQGLLVPFLRSLAAVVTHRRRQDWQLKLQLELASSVKHRSVYHQVCDSLQSSQT